MTQCLVDFPSVFSVMSFSLRLNYEKVRLIRPFLNPGGVIGTNGARDFVKGLWKVVFTS